MLAEEEQHAERRAVHVFRLTQIDDVLSGATWVLLINLAKFLVHAKIETPADVAIVTTFPSEDMRVTSAIICCPLSYVLKPYTLKQFHVPCMHRRLCHGLMGLRLSLFPSVRQGGAESQEWRAVVGLSCLRESRT
jgi:hypothetical protein